MRGRLLGVRGAIMILSGSISAIKKLIALGGVALCLHYYSVAGLSHPWLEGGGSGACFSVDPAATLLNLGTFAFLGAMCWLLLRP